MNDVNRIMRVHPTVHGSDQLQHRLPGQSVNRPVARPVSRTSVDCKLVGARSSQPAISIVQVVLLAASAEGTLLARRPPRRTHRPTAVQPVSELPAIK